MFQKSKYILLALWVGLFQTQCSNDYLFNEVSPTQSGISFANQLTDTEELSILDYLYFITVAGLLLGTSTMMVWRTFISRPTKGKTNSRTRGTSSSKTSLSLRGVVGNADWNTGVTMVDVNNDGWLIFTFALWWGIHGFRGYNELYINQQDGIFKRNAVRYGLALQNYSVSAAFLIMTATATSTCIS